jgi:hypothetical protein
MGELYEGAQIFEHGGLLWRGADKPETCSIGIIIVPIMKLWKDPWRIIVTAASASMLSRKTGCDMRIGSVSNSLLTLNAGGTASLITGCGTGVRCPVCADRNSWSLRG